MTSPEEREKRPVKPNLRVARGNTRLKQIIFAACVLVTIYMYPTIIRPLFGIGTSVDKDDTKDKIREINKILSKHRPDNMPDWTSPFAPKKGREP